MYNERNKCIKRKQNLIEEIFNSVSHGFMIPFGIVCLIIIIKQLYSLQHIGSYKYISVIFPFSNILLYLMSTLYHSLSFTKAKKIFQKFDHISIYLLILGTFTPFLFLHPSLKKIIFLNWNKGQLFFIFQFLIVLIGIFLKLFWIDKWQFMHILFFLFLGWSSLFILKDLFSTNSSFSICLFLFLGGLFYSLGVYFYLKDYRRYYHFIWHIFVMKGTIFHSIAVIFFLNSLQFDL